jgi:hypothetical protein
MTKQQRINQLAREAKETERNALVLHGEIHHLKTLVESKNKDLESSRVSFSNYRVWAEAHINDPEKPLPMLLWCPECNARHIDEGVWAEKAHRSHACQFCGHVWRPAIINTFGVKFLPGFKNP